MPLPLSHIPILALWEPVHRDDWGRPNARHLLERAGFSSTSTAVEEIADLGPEAACTRLFSPSRFKVPEWIVKKSAEFDRLSVEAREAEDREKRQELYRERSQIGREAVLELEFEWLRRASQPEYGARSKWELFLSDVWVTGKRAVPNPGWQASYWVALSEKSDLPYPAFCKDLSREPAMMRYLDLDRSSKARPNENFTRELFELFTLGEGNYSESDIKEASRAFTGRRLPGGNYREIPGQQDKGSKTVFSQTGPWTGDDVIDLIFRQPAARTFLPSEAIRYYLTEQPFDANSIKLLGDLWAEEGFRLDALRRRLFCSRAFYANDLRGSRIKSPVEIFLGSLQRLGLQPAPLPSHTIRPLRDMGQELFEPPNVRGWIGGEAWINAGKLAARRNCVQLLFQPLPMKRLNADDKQRIKREQERPDFRPFSIRGTELVALTGTSPDVVLQFIESDLLVLPPGETLTQQIRDYLGPEPSAEKIQQVILTVLQSPQYQLS